MNARRALAILIILIVSGAAGSSLLLHRANAAVAPPDRSSFDPAVVAKGAQLAAVGNCGACHTDPGGKPYAGGLAMKTPFGTIYSTNITPDPDTGIGKWSAAEFNRAMHDGVDRAGRELYPAFPYDHFTKVTDEDVNAIYAFIMTRDPVRATTPANELSFPFNSRPLVAGWKLLFFDKGVFQPDPSRSEEWNRGAYLVEGIGHCGACHTPRNALGAEKKREHLAGGEAQGWHAPAMNAASPAPLPWSVDQIFNYLRNGRDDRHGIAAGPMAPVIHNLSQVPEPDVRAIANYVAWIAGSQNADSQDKLGAAAAPAKPQAYGAVPGQIVAKQTEARSNATPAATEGAVIFAGACASCHQVGGTSPVAPSNAPAELALTTSVNAPDPRNVIHVIVEGIWPEAGESGALMPGFAGALTDQQVVALVAYLRERFSDLPAWRDVTDRVRDITKREDER